MSESKTTTSCMPSTRSANWAKPPSRVLINISTIIYSTTRHIMPRHQKTHHDIILPATLRHIISPHTSSRHYCQSFHTLLPTHNPINLSKSNTTHINIISFQLNYYSYQRVKFKSTIRNWGTLTPFQIQIHMTNTHIYKLFIHHSHTQIYKYINKL